LTEKDLAFLLHQWIGDRVCTRNSKTFKEWLISKLAEEAIAGILNEKVEDGQGSQLSV
jgi:hypothetical protein